MRLRLSALLLLLAFCLSAVAAEPNSFAIVSLATPPRNLGKASYTLEKTKDGYRIRSRFEYHISTSALPAATRTAGADPDDPAGVSPSSGRRGGGAGTGLIIDGQYSAEYKLDDSGNFLNGFTQNVANQLLTSFQPNKKRNELTISQTQAGVVGNAHDIQLPSAQFLLAPSFDPSAIQMLLIAAATHPQPNATYLLVIPAGGISRGDIPAYVILQQVPTNRTGTLDGKPVTVRHIRMNFHVGHADLFTDESGLLLQADIDTLNASYIRAHFVLNP